MVDQNQENLSLVDAQPENEDSVETILDSLGPKVTGTLAKKIEKKGLALFVDMVPTDQLLILHQLLAISRNTLEDEYHAVSLQVAVAEYETWIEHCSNIQHLVREALDKKGIQV